MKTSRMTTPPPRRYRRMAGFTLIELMIAVVVASILVSIAVPTYTSSIRKSRRTEAKSALLDLAGREERYINANPNIGYTAVAANLGYTSATTSITNLAIGSGYYAVTVSALAPTTVGTVYTPSSYTVTAIPLTPDQLKDTQCLYFYLDNTGKQTSNTSTAATGTDTSTTCWK